MAVNLEIAEGKIGKQEADLDGNMGVICYLGLGLDATATNSSRHGCSGSAVGGERAAREGELPASG